MAVSRITLFGNIVTMRIFQCPLIPFNRALKRAFDVAVAIAGLIMVSPLLVFVALAIKLGFPRLVLFRQRRHGYDNEPIYVLKFRTITVMADGDNFRPVVRHDPRVTRRGHLLRQTNIDELPQLFNVLVGDMSLVGPRPHATSQNEAFAELISSFSRSHNVEPGTTGWAQVDGYRGEIDTREDAASGGARSVLYRQLVTPSRSKDRGHDLVFQKRVVECLLTPFRLLHLLLIGP
jgi:putative colanic acid biosynthesis UDP-glucose lipid carrier transferase